MIGPGHLYLTLTLVRTNQCLVQDICINTDISSDQSMFGPGHLY